ncbi:MAG: hypothetical protein M3460_18355 [Actinomycetota bacterium]|nr:hypothetical protein [Actinomycetota bacterium]
MAPYRVRYVTHAAEQRKQVPRSMHTAFDARMEDLERDPYAVGTYDKSEGNYTTTFGETGRETGIIVYTASDKIDMVTIVRTLCAEW